MKIRVATLCGITCLVFAQAALAAGRDRLPYTGVEASMGRVLSDNSTVGADWLGLRASLDLAGPVFVSASRTEIESDAQDPASLIYSAKLRLSRFDLGLHFGNDSTANFVPSISLVETRAELNSNFFFFEPQSETGWAARTAVRALATSWLELGAHLEMLMISDDVSTTAAAEAILYPLRHVGVGVAFETSEGQQAVMARLRLVQ